MGRSSSRSGCWLISTVAWLLPETCETCVARDRSSLSANAHPRFRPHVFFALACRISWGVPAMGGDRERPRLGSRRDLVYPSVEGLGGDFLRHRRGHRLERRGEGPHSHASLASEMPQERPQVPIHMFWNLCFRSSLVVSTCSAKRLSTGARHSPSHVCHRGLPRASKGIPRLSNGVPGAFQDLPRPSIPTALQDV